MVDLLESILESIPESIETWHWIVTGIVFFAVIYFRIFRKKIVRRAAFLQAKLSTHPRMVSPLIGKPGKVVEASKGQKSKVRIADKVWEVRCKQNLELDDEVRVRSIDGSTLHVSKLV